MPSVDKLMGLATVSSVFMEGLLLKRFLLGVAGLLVFAVVIGVAVAALLAAGLYLAYRLMLEHGLSADTALIAVSGGGMVFVLIFAIIAMYRFRALRRRLKPRPDLTAKISQIAEAFVNGLLTPTARN